jgi:Arc/MetJ family transcription regulator
MKKKTTIYLDEVDRKAIATIKQMYGITSESDAIRLALRLAIQHNQPSSKEEKRS